MLEKVIRIAKEAGQIIRENYRKDFTVEYKTNSSNLVTEVDKKAEKIIIDFIKKEYPTHGVLAEESGETKNSSEYIWVIDPLDGTTNFAHGLPIFAVSIGVQKNSETLYGIVYDVMNDFAYVAEKGGGAYSNNRKMVVNQNDDLSHSVLVTGFPYNIKENPNNAVEKFNRFLMQSRAVRRLGSAAIDLALVADGIFDGFWEVHLYPWDMCAGQLLVEEAGGKVTNFKNERMNIFDKQLLATNGKIHEQMREILNS